MTGAALLQPLLEPAIVVALIGLVGTLVKAVQKWRTDRAAAPDQKLDTALERQDKLYTNLQEALAYQTQRANDAEARDSARAARVLDLETQLSQVRAKLIEATEQLAHAHRELDSLRTDPTPETT